MTQEGLLSPGESERAAEWLALVNACVKNGDDLVSDSELLLAHSRPARALSLAVLAFEEYGKALQALVVIGAGGNAQEIATYRRQQSSHRPKVEAGQAWTAISSRSEALDESFTERSRQIVAGSAQAKMNGFYVDWTETGIRTPDQTAELDADSYITRARSLGKQVHQLVTLLQSEQQLHAMWRFGPEIIPQLVALTEGPDGKPAETINTLRSWLPKLGLPPTPTGPDSGTEMHFLGVDLAWADGATKPNETGLVLLNSTGNVLEAGWTRGVEQTLKWIHDHVSHANVLAFIDAPLVVHNATGQRRCETQVGQRYGRWQVSANSTNTTSKNAAGLTLLEGLRQAGWSYDDGFDGPASTGRRISECYPYTTLVGAAELGYDIERPRYKRKPQGSLAATWRPARASACDELLVRMASLSNAEPPLALHSHPATAELLLEPSPNSDIAYKHREDLLDAAICAWTVGFPS